MENHKNSKHKSSEIKCKYCGEQFSQMSELEDHFKRVHGLDNMKCRNCKEEFEKKSDLMVHRKSKHNELVAQCRKNLIGKCYFTSSLCWWNHSKKDEQNIECYYCDKDFESVSHIVSVSYIGKKSTVELLNLVLSLFKRIVSFLVNFAGISMKLKYYPIS